MKITSVHHIDGPNRFTYRPVLVARVELEELTRRETTDFSTFSDRLLRVLPGLAEHHCAKGQPGGFVERLYGGTYFGHVVEHVAIELATLAGFHVSYGKTMFAGPPEGLYDIVMECEVFKPQHRLLTQALELVQSLLTGRGLPRIENFILEAKNDLEHWQLGPSTQAIVDAAKRRGIPVRRLTDSSLVQLGYGVRRKLVAATLTEQTSAVATDIACDKEMTKAFLMEHGLPVPAGVAVHSLEQALAGFRDLGGPVVVKPLNGNQGRGVTLNLNSEVEVAEAFAAASEISSVVLLERYVAGRNVRLFVVGGTLVAAAERIPALVQGDGYSSVDELIQRINAHPLRGDGHGKPLSKITVDSVVLHTLRRQGLTLQSIVPQGRTVWLRESANLSTGGQAVDVTDELDDSYRVMGERVARLIGLDVCGIDMIIQDPAKSCIAGAAVVLEVNAAPGIRMHLFPSVGRERAVGDAIVNHLFGSHDGRIPIIAITGTNGKTTTTRLIGHALSLIGKRVGMTTTSGVWIDGQQVLQGDTTGPRSARTVLADPHVEVAVLETARGGIVRGGLGYDKASVAVLTNITLDHLGQDGTDSLEDLMHIKSLVGECVEEGGTVVVNADDERLVRLLPRFRARISLFARCRTNPILSRHLKQGGSGYYVADGWITEARGQLTWRIVPVTEIPLTLQGKAGFHVENCLAATGALRASGCTRAQVAEGLTRFLPEIHNPGRCMVFHLPNDSFAVIDYGHNPDGFAKVGNWLHEVPHRRLVGVVGVPGDRCDEVVRTSAQTVAEVFDELVIKEDQDKRGRYPGEVATLIAEEVRHHSLDKKYTVLLDESEALRFALGRLGPGDIAVMFYERLQPAVQIVEEFGGHPSSSLTATQLSALVLP